MHAVGTGSHLCQSIQGVDLAALPLFTDVEQPALRADGTAPTGAIAVAAGLITCGTRRQTHCCDAVQCCAREICKCSATCAAEVIIDKLNTPADVFRPAGLSKTSHVQGQHL